MAFTLQSFVADSTLGRQRVALADFVPDPTLVRVGVALADHVADSTLGRPGLDIPDFQMPPQGWLERVQASSTGGPTGSFQSLQALSATGQASQSTYSIATLQGITAQGTSGAISAAALQRVSAAGAGVSVLIGSVQSLELIGGSGAAELEAQAGASAATLQLVQAAGETLVVGTSAAVLGRLLAAAQGVSGSIGASTITLPLVEAGAQGVVPAVGTATVVLPLIVAHSTGYTAAGTNWSAVAMHTEAQGLTTYSNYPFNSFCQFNGVWLGATDSGIFALTGNTDAGTFIDAAARVGMTDYGTSFLKRIDRCYVGYRTDGNLILRVFTDEVNERQYLLTATGKSGLHGNHIRIGKGLAARYWQFEIANQNGADFELNMLEVKPTKLKRRVGGGDA